MLAHRDQPSERRQGARPRCGSRRWATLGLAILVTACGSRPPAPSRVRHLLSSLGDPQVRKLRDETRPTIELRPGESRRCRVDVAKGTELRFSSALFRPPERGFLRLRVLANGTPIFTHQVFAQRQGRWWHHSVELPFEGTVELEFRGDHVWKSGEPYPTAAEDQRPWIWLASTRLCPPADPGRDRVFVWLSVDTVRRDHHGAGGYERATSPSFDRLARESAVLDRAIAPASWTLPSMTSMFTARYPSFHGAGLRTARDTVLPTLFDQLAADGFSVFGVSGNHFISATFNLAGGFDALWYSDGGADAVNSLARQALEERGGGDLALLVHYMDPHAPYLPPAPFDRVYDPSYSGAVTGWNFENYPSARDLAHTEALYDGELRYVDSRIAALLKDLEGGKLLANAVIAYTSDHGEEFLDHGGWTHGKNLYEENLRVPTALRIPGIAPQRVGRPVSLIDLAPTVLDCFGIEAPDSFHGRSLLPLLRGEGGVAEPVFSETGHNRDGNHRVAVRDGALKYTLITPPDEQIPPAIFGEQLFDVEHDPQERSPLDPTTATRLRELALAFLSRARSEGEALVRREISPEIEEQLRALGYVE